MISHQFQQELCALLNRHSIEGECSMPDFLLAEMLCGVIRAVGPKVKKTLEWHGTRSVCHSGPTACSASDIGGEPIEEQTLDKMLADYVRDNPRPLHFAVTEPNS